MKKRNVLIVLFIITILGFIIAGASLAYFIDNDENSDPKFVLGTVAIDISPGNEEENVLGPLAASKTGKWIIKNIGSKAVKLRARVSTEWEADQGDKVCNEEGSAWAVHESIIDKKQEDGDSPRFGQGNNQGRYNIYTASSGYSEEDPFKLKLGVDENYTKVGTVSVWDDGNKIYIKIETIGNRIMPETHLYLGTEKPTNSAPGQLGYKSSPNGNEYMYQLPLPSTNEEIYIAVHAEVWKCTSAGGTTGTVEPPDYEFKVLTESWVGPKGEEDWYYYCSDVKSGEEIEFELQIEIGDAWEGNLELSLEAEAVQASNNAIEAEWDIKWEEISTMCRAKEDDKDE